MYYSDAVVASHPVAWVLCGEWECGRGRRRRCRGSGWLDETARGERLRAAWVGDGAVYSIFAMHCTVVDIDKDCTSFSKEDFHSLG